MNRISNMYLSIVTSAFSIYYLPRLSEIKDSKELKAEVFRCYKFIIPILIIAMIIIYLTRKIILDILFTPEFYSMQKLFSWQLLGDFFKICSWLLSFIMVAKAKMKIYIVSEVMFSLTYVTFSFIFLNMFGIVGLPQGYLISYILYFMSMIVLFKIVFTR